MLKDRKRLGRRGIEEEGAPDPLSSLSNLSDIMLVFACGLMVALVMNLKVDISRLDEAVIRYEADSTTKVEKSNGRGMDEVGTVYRDPKTGKTYIVEKDSEEDSEEDEEDTETEEGTDE